MSAPLVRRVWYTAKMQGDPLSCVKRKAADLVPESESLRVFVFKGSPGAIVAEGQSDVVDVFATYLRKLPWKALKWVGDDQVDESGLHFAESNVTVFECADRAQKAPEDEGRRCDYEKCQEICGYDLSKGSAFSNLLLEVLGKGKGKGKGFRPETPSTDMDWKLKTAVPQERREKATRWVRSRES